MRHKSIKAKLAAVSVFIFILLSVSGMSMASENTSEYGETQQLIKQQYEAGGLDRIRDELERYADDESMDLLGGYDADELMDDLLNGSAGLDLKGIGSNILRFLFGELYQNLGILVKITALVIICALLKNLQADFMSEGAGRIAFYLCYIVTVSFLLVSFGTVIKMGMGIIDKMVGFMYATVPVLLALLISGGNITAGGILHPAILLIVETAATLIRNVFVPLVFLSTILMIVNNISDKIQLTRLVNLIKQIVSWALGIILTVFIIAVTLQGSLGAVIDGATQKAAKFAMSTFIPIVGKTLSDAVDTVIGCTLLIKNTAGAAAMIGILIICIVPLLKIIAMAGLFKAASALLEPISESKITNCINDVAGAMLYIFALTAAVAVMFIICVTALTSAGNMSAMLR
jgi:stage III sporulation protein AE